MGIVCVDPLIHNIAILSEQQKLCDIEREYIADPLAHWLIPRGSLLGKVIVWFYWVLAYVGWCYEQKNLQTILKSAQVALATLQHQLIDCSASPSTPVSTFLSLSFDEEWQNCFRRVDHLLGGEGRPFSFEKAQRVIAPIIIQEITRAPIPWDLFELLLHQKRIDVFDKERLSEWVEDVRVWGSFISPYLILSLCEAAACRMAPGASPSQQASYAFFLAWSLYKAGLSELSSPDVHTVDVKGGLVTTTEGEYELFFGEAFPLAFATEFPISARSVQGYPQLMALISESPLLLGMWVHNINECPSVIPSLRIISCDCRGRYVIVERLFKSFADAIWEKDGCREAHDTALLAKIAELGSMLLGLPITLDLELDHLFLTSDLSIRTIAPLQVRFSFFCLTEVEIFLRSMCHHDQERVSLLFHRIGLFHHPEALMYRSLIEKFVFSATDPDIARELAIFGIDTQNFRYAARWMHSLRRHAGIIRGQCEDVFQQAGLSPREQMVKIASAMLKTQEQIGWCSSIPPQLSEHVISLLRQNDKSHQDPLQTLATSWT